MSDERPEGGNGSESRATDGTDEPDDASEPGDGVRRVRVDDLPSGLSPARAKREVDEAVGATAFGFNVYEADPGELVPWGRHRHPEHEELFYVERGTLVVETDAGTETLEAGEALFVPPDHHQRAVAGAEGVRFVAAGAPKATDGSVIEEECESCGEVTRWEARVESDGVEDEGGRTVVLTCGECGAETRRFSSG
jgi:quercetin dioxygenase-like cupin family protein